MLFVVLLTDISVVFSPFSASSLSDLAKAQMGSHQYLGFMKESGSLLAGSDFIEGPRVRAYVGCEGRWDE